MLVTKTQSGISIFYINSYLNEMIRLSLFDCFAEKASRLIYSACLILKGSHLLRLINGRWVNTLHL